jgi:hypothetical protein
MNIEALQIRKITRRFGSERDGDQPVLAKICGFYIAAKKAAVDFRNLHRRQRGPSVPRPSLGGACEAARKRPCNDRPRELEPKKGDPRHPAVVRHLLWYVSLRRTPSRTPCSAWPTDSPSMTGHLPAVRSTSPAVDVRRPICQRVL